MIMMKRSATRETITGGSSAPPARQALILSQYTPSGQVNKPDAAGETLRVVWRQSQTKAETSRWWRTTPSESKDDEITQEAATGGEDTPPARQVFDSDTPILENTDEPIIEIHTTENTQMPANANIDATKAKPTRQGKRERRHAKDTTTARAKRPEHEQLTGEGQISPARQVPTAADIPSEAPDETPTVADQQHRQKPSALRRRAIVERRDARQRKGEEREKLEAIAQREAAGWLGREESSAGNIPRRSDEHGGR
ncbi:hypothetical protein C8J57DRAFT_1243266 [Mycena rebaudengoi]|nr:hypothetical protein C8J57DRAFT_1243266 [Mycena rebaudengoi]